MQGGWVSLLEALTHTEAALAPFQGHLTFIVCFYRLVRQYFKFFAVILNCPE